MDEEISLEFKFHKNIENNIISSLVSYLSPNKDELKYSCNTIIHYYKNGLKGNESKSKLTYKNNSKFENIELLVSELDHFLFEIQNNETIDFRIISFEKGFPKKDKKIINKTLKEYL